MKCAPSIQYTGAMDENGISVVKMAASALFMKNCIICMVVHSMTLFVFPANLNAKTRLV